jgi:glycosyltransferase involved in cell wall biosynthesis
MDGHLMSVDFINFGYNPWSEYWKRNQTIFELLCASKWVDRGVFVNDSAWLVDAIIEPSQLWRVPSRFRWQGVCCDASIGDERFRVTPLRWPAEGRVSGLQKLPHWQINRRLRPGHSRWVMVNNPIPSMRVLIEPHWRQAKLKIFDWSDDFARFASSPLQAQEVQDQVDDYIREADIVLTVNDALTERAVPLNANAFTLTNATNLLTFETRLPQPQITERLAALPKPIWGYMGWINRERLDQALLMKAAQQLPGSLVLVGPVSAGGNLDEVLMRHPNVHLLPAIDYRYLSGLMSLFDVCLLPNLDNAHTRGNDPIKIYDYLATGKPIVSTQTSGVSRFNHLIHLAKNHDEFIEACLACLDDPNRGREDRLASARSHSWPVRIERLFDQIRHHIEEGACG